MRIDGVHFPLPSDLSDKVYVVIGLPGSGTTFLAKAIQRTLIELHGPGINNRFQVEGNPISKINRDILADAGGSLYIPPSMENIIESGRAYRDDMALFVTSMEQDYWGVKDPRLSFTLPAWDAAFTEFDDVYVVAVFRKPDRVASNWVRTGKYSEFMAQALAAVKRNQRRVLRTIAAFLKI